MATTVAPRQESLFGGGAPTFDADVRPQPIDLGDGAWIAHVPGWLHGDRALADHLDRTTTWHAHRRPMYDRMVDVPRLTATLPRDGQGHPVLDGIASWLEDRFGEPCDRVSLAWYRCGQDSVAPHGDQVARDLDTTTMATVSCGAPRRFVLRQVAGPGRHTLHLGDGDLLVMGGSIQRTWRHGVPKTTRPVGPRLCIMFRPPWLV